jgi:uncharacterized tellurite resistance protein B-like protein
MDIREFYIAIGKLLYAVADADSVISGQEKKELYQLINSRLIERESHTDQFGTNDAWYAAFEFEAAEEMGMTAGEAFVEFEEYIRNHWDAMDNDLKGICMQLADKIAESCHHTNRSEKEMIRKLRDLLYSIQPQSHYHVKDHRSI